MTQNLHFNKLLGQFVCTSELKKTAWSRAKDKGLYLTLGSVMKC